MSHIEQLRDLLAVQLIDPDFLLEIDPAEITVRLYMIIHELLHITLLHIFHMGMYVEPSMLILMLDQEQVL